MIWHQYKCTRVETNSDLIKTSALVLITVQTDTVGSITRLKIMPICSRMNTRGTQFYSDLLTVVGLV